MCIHACPRLKTGLDHTFNSPLTFFEEPKCLSVGKDTLDVDADGSLVRVLAPDHGESQALVARTLHEDHILDAVHLALSLAWQRAELGFVTSLEKIVRCGGASMPRNPGTVS
jgi:hypothetical protein